MSALDAAAVRRLGEQDLAQCLERSQEAGWNQNADDWRLVFAIGEAVGLFRGGHLIATAATVPHGDGIGWICMVLTAKSARREGHATRLMGWAMDRLAAAGLCAGLDATEEGAKVYRRLGFETVCRLTRMRAEAVQPPLEGQPVSSAAVEPLTARHLPALLNYDLARFGGDRGTLLRALFARRPEFGAVATAEEGLKGFVLGRDGPHAEHIGPVVAEDAAVAMRLIEAALKNASGPTVIDIMDTQSTVGRWLNRCAFLPQRGFERMLLNAARPAGRPDAIVAATGPEFG